MCGADECWPWTAGRFRDGDYGRFWLEGHYIGAHKMAWTLHNKKQVPDGLQVLHSCHNPPCCNPVHLRTGTREDNMLDKEQAGRGNHPRGEAHGRAKLTQIQVDEIRALYSTGNHTQAVLASQFQVAPALISFIVNYVIWREN